MGLVSEEQWTVLRALKTGGPPHGEQAVAQATGLQETAVRQALEALARVEPPLAESGVDVRRGERFWTATMAADDALAAVDPPEAGPRESPPPY